MSQPMHSYDKSDNGWTKVTQDNKRKRTSTGDGSSTLSQTINDDFKNLSIDEKLISMFREFGKLGEKVDNCISILPDIKNIEHSIDEHDMRLTFLEYKTIDLEARSRRNNLIFHGLHESREENCTNVIMDVLRNNLGIAQCPTIPRAHRLGRFNRGMIRPIIVNFLDSRDAEHIISKANKLRGTPISINRDFPKEIASARKSLWPKVKELKRAHPNCKIALVYPSKIVKDGQVVEDSFPLWDKVLSGTRFTPVARQSENVTSIQHTTSSDPHHPSPQEAPTSSPRRARQSRRASKSPRSRGHVRGHAPSRPAGVNTSHNHVNSDNSDFNRPWVRPNQNHGASDTAAGHNG